MAVIGMHKLAYDFKDTQCLDCRLVAKGQGNKNLAGMVSSTMLAAASPLLQQILPPPSEDREDTVILLPDWPFEIVNKAIEYIYTGEVVSKDNATHSALTAISSLLESLGISISDVEVWDPEDTRSNTNSSASKDLPTCDICGESFKMNIQLNRHKKIAHKDEDFSKNDQSSIENTGQTNHLKTDKPRSLLLLFSDENWRNCPICSQNNLDPVIFNRSEYFVNHLFSHMSFAEIVSRQEPDLEMYSCEQQNCPMMYKAQEKKIYLKHKYGCCKHDQAGKQCGPFLKLNSHLLNILEQFTLGQLKFVEEELQEHGEVSLNLKYEDSGEEMEHINDQVSMEDASVTTSRRTPSRATSCTSESNCGDPIKCRHCKRVFHSQKQYGRHECVLNPPKEVIEEDPRPDATKRNSHECKICNGPKNLKPVLKDKESLMSHYLLGHYQNFFKRNPKNNLHIEEFPWACIKCVDKEPEKLNNWEEVILHLGKDHERLYYALQHDRTYEMRNVQKFLFPERDKREKRHRAKRSASRTPEKRRSKSSMSNKSNEKSTEKRKNVDSPGTQLSIKRPKLGVEAINVPAQASSPLLSDNEVEPLEPLKKHIRNLNHETSHEDLINSSQDDLEKLRSDKATSWEEEMNRAGTARGITDSGNDAMKRPKAGVICNMCEEIFATKENMRLHTCESRLDQRDLNEATTGFRKKRTSSSSARTSSSSVDQLQEINRSTVAAFRNPTGKTQSSNPMKDKQTKNREIPQASKNRHVDIILEPVTSEVSNDEEETAGRMIVDSNLTSDDLFLNIEDEDKGEKQKECHVSKTASAISRTMGTDDGGGDSSNELKCDNCHLVFPNKNVKKRHMMCRHCQHTCINLKVHKYCVVCERCYTEGISPHYICDVCEDKCFKEKEEMQIHKSAHSWDDYT